MKPGGNSLAYGPMQLHGELSHTSSPIPSSMRCSSRSSWKSQTRQLIAVSDWSAASSANHVGSHEGASGSTTAFSVFLMITPRRFVAAETAQLTRKGSCLRQAWLDEHLQMLPTLCRFERFVSLFKRETRSDQRGEEVRAVGEQLKSLLIIGIRVRR